VLAFTITNTSGAVVSFTSLDTISIQLPEGTKATDLSATLSSATVSIDNPACSAYVANYSGQKYIMVSTAKAKLDLAPGDILTVRLSDFTVNDTVGTVQFQITDFISDQVPPLALTKKQRELDLNVGIGAQVAGLNTPVTISWKADKASHLTVAPLGLDIPLSSDGSGQIQVVPWPRQTTYTLTAWTNDQQSISENVVVSVNRPQITNFAVLSAGKPVTADTKLTTDQDVTISWDTEFAQAPIIFTPFQNGVAHVPTFGNMTFQPGRLLTRQAPTVLISMIAQGYEKNAQRDVVFYFADMQIAAFRYKTLDFTFSLNVRAVNCIAGPNVVPIGSAGDDWEMKAEGWVADKLSNITCHLGDVDDTQLMYVGEAGQTSDASLATKKAGDKVTLLLVVGNAKSLEVDGTEVTLQAPSAALVPNFSTYKWGDWTKANPMVGTLEVTVPDSLSLPVQAIGSATMKQSIAFGES
jgi:hypothetical protein